MNRRQFMAGLMASAAVPALPLFKVGDWIAVAGLDIQGVGFHNVIRFTGCGSLPSGIIASTPYYVTSVNPVSKAITFTSERCDES